jgi:hypothetical protein
MKDCQHPHCVSYGDLLIHLAKEDVREKHSPCCQECSEFYEYRFASAKKCLKIIERMKLA